MQRSGQRRRKRRSSSRVRTTGIARRGYTNKGDHRQLLVTKLHQSTVLLSIYSNDRWRVKPTESRLHASLSPCNMKLNFPYFYNISIFLKVVQRYCSQIMLRRIPFEDRELKNKILFLAICQNTFSHDFRYLSILESKNDCVAR